MSILGETAQLAKGRIKGGSPVFHQDSKTIVADHQQLKSAIGAEAISSTHAHPIVRQSSWCLPSGIRYNRPRLCQVDMSPRRLAGSVISTSRRRVCAYSVALSIPKGRRSTASQNPSQQALCNNLRLFAPRIRSTNQTSSGGHVLESPAASPPLMSNKFVSEDTVRD